ncbi:MAG: ABC transporter ATP-binding protein [Chloroflexi bacterium]|nr:ABC transporter ATP-binding protein [Chloroflexota bacterium]
MIVIDLQNVSKTFRDNGTAVEALADVTFQVQAGEFVTLIGPSGSGKSTIFNLITGLIEPDTGTVRVHNEPPRSGTVGYMPQRDLLLPWRTVVGNAIIPLEIAGMPREQAQQRARDMLPTFGLEGFADAYPASLSGGMRQRTALLRTMLTDADTLLFDEPFGALDALTRRALQDWLLDLWRGMEKTILFVTHDVEEALYLGDRVLVLSARPGRIEHTQTVEFSRPRERKMMADPAFGRQLTDLLSALGIE